MRQGTVRVALAEGEVVRSASGRLTCPIPKIDFDSERKAGNAAQRVEQWLIQYALDEAVARGDDLNALQFRACLRKPQQAHKECAEQYLFCQQPAIITSPLSMLAPMLYQA